MTMKQSIVAWLCILALAVAGNTSCYVDATKRANDAGISVYHQIALDKCFDDAVAAYHITQDLYGTEREYSKCAASAKE
jgi:hypothetical protein